MKTFDIIVIGCGASGLSAARAALANNKTVLILDMGEKPARKVAVSGGGRCNFTNSAVAYDRYFGQNPSFVKSVLANIKSTDILDWAKSHNLKWVEKKPGQFFCATNSSDFVSALLSDVKKAEILLSEPVKDIEKHNETFLIKTDTSVFAAKSVIIATGGISYPTLTVSDFGYMVAKKFGHKIIPLQPALCQLKTHSITTELAGISLPVKIKIGKNTINDDLLFTHQGIGGPAAYRTSLYELNNGIYINFLPNLDVYKWLIESKNTDGKKILQTILIKYFTRSLARFFSNNFDKNIADISNKDIKTIADNISNFYIPSSDLKLSGMHNAEVTKGGISTEFISSKTMESKLCHGLYFAGEVIDITGDLGGFNLHFAFASGLTAGKYA